MLADGADNARLKAKLLSDAVEIGDVREVLRLLQEEHADPNVEDSAGETPLFEAVACGNTELTAALLVCAADPDRRACSGFTATALATKPPVRTLLELFGGNEVDNYS